MGKPQIRFQDKAKSKEEQEKAFLALMPSERFMAFLRLCEYYAQFETQVKPDTSNNWVIEPKEK